MQCSDEEEEQQRAGCLLLPLFGAPCLTRSIAHLGCIVSCGCWMVLQRMIESLAAEQNVRDASRSETARSKLTQQWGHSSLSFCSRDERAAIFSPLSASVLFCVCFCCCCSALQGYLLMLLEKEQSNESERVRLLASVEDVGDQRRLEKIFAIERAKAAKVIRAVTTDHERTLALKMQQLGLISDDEDDEYMQHTRATK